MTIFTVIAYRFGELDRTSYFVGVYDDLVRAYRAAIAEEYWRGGKYECVVHESEINECDLEKEEWCAEQYLPDGDYALEIMVRVNKHKEGE